jgi:hypothetical protein
MGGLIRSPQVIMGGLIRSQLNKESCNFLHGTIIKDYIYMCMIYL